jgi:hypothetical protein
MREVLVIGGTGAQGLPVVKGTLSKTASSPLFDLRADLLYSPVLEQ